MIVLSGSCSQPKGSVWFAKCPPGHQMGMLLGPAAWRKPWCEVWACDNDAFSHSRFSDKYDPDWWRREGETAWLKMLDKAAKARDEGTSPLFCILPDEPGDFARTVEKAWFYLPELRQRNLPVALALQDGPVEQVAAAATMLLPDWWFVGGTKPWKWNHAAELRELAHSTFGTKLHIGRVCGKSTILDAKRAGADSCDGSVMLAFADSKMPDIFAGLQTEPSPYRKTYAKNLALF